MVSKLRTHNRFSFSVRMKRSETPPWTCRPFFHRFLDDYYSPRAATVETVWPRALRFLTTGLANEAFRVEGEPVAMLAAGSARARRSSLARSPVLEPAYGLSGRGRWSAESRCQNTGDGVRFRVSHW